MGWQPTGPRGARGAGARDAGRRGRRDLSCKCQDSGQEVLDGGWMGIWARRGDFPASQPGCAGARLAAPGRGGRPDVAACTLDADFARVCTFRRGIPSNAAYRRRRLHTRRKRPASVHTATSPGAERGAGTCLGGGRGRRRSGKRSPSAPADRKCCAGGGRRSSQHFLTRVAGPAVVQHFLSGGLTERRRGKGRPAGPPLFSAALLPRPHVTGARVLPTAGVSAARPPRPG
jgi:hypothetical protein